MEPGNHDPNGWQHTDEVTDMAMRPSRRLRVYFGSLIVLQCVAFALLMRVPGSHPYLRAAIAMEMFTSVCLLHYLLRLTDAVPSHWPRRIAGVLLWPLLALPALLTMLFGLVQASLYWPLGLYGGVAALLTGMLGSLYVFFLNEPGEHTG